MDRGTTRGSPAPSSRPNRVMLLRLRKGFRQPAQRINLPPRASYPCLSAIVKKKARRLGWPTDASGVHPEAPYLEAIMRAVRVGLVGSQFVSTIHAEALKRIPGA